MNKVKHAVGVLCGRFQIDNLTEGHIKLFDYVSSKHDIVIVMLGSHYFPNEKNALSFKHREQMIRESYPNVICVEIVNERTDEAWSKTFDSEVSRKLDIGQTPILYGSRDSFTSSYHGVYETEEVEEVDFVSATARRDEIYHEYKSTAERRAGIISGTMNRYPVNYVTVDIAILDSIKNPKRILLGRKSNETQYRFIGGFSEPTSQTLEEDAMREAREEASKCVDDDIKVVSYPTYVCSQRIDDYRYRDSRDSICTTFFKSEWIHDEHPVGNDDIEEVRWFNLSDIIDIVDGHAELYAKLLTNLTS